MEKCYTLKGQSLENGLSCIFQVIDNILFLKNIYLFIWLRRVLVAVRGVFVEAYGIFCCGTRASV